MTVTKQIDQKHLEDLQKIGVGRPHPGICGQGKIFSNNKSKEEQKRRDNGEGIKRLLQNTSLYFAAVPTIYRESDRVCY